MTRFRSGDQPDLFAEVGDTSAAEAPPSDFIERIRGELTTTLSRVREAAALPWKDLTAATLAELRFNSIAGWLPQGEASELRSAFHSEMNRLYLIAERGGAENASQTG
jgi:hypothetical protein